MVTFNNNTSVAEEIGFEEVASLLSSFYNKTSDITMAMSGGELPWHDKHELCFVIKKNQ